MGFRRSTTQLQRRRCDQAGSLLGQRGDGVGDRDQADRREARRTEVLPDLLVREGFEELPVTVVHGHAAGDLPHHHGDPFDRMLIAQAAAERLTIVTADRAFAAYGVPVLW